MRGSALLVSTPEIPAWRTCRTGLPAALLVGQTFTFRRHRRLLKSLSLRSASLYIEIVYIEIVLPSDLLPALT
jgi:hypothetical protein